MTIDKKTLARIAQADKEVVDKYGADAFDDFDCRPRANYPEANSDAVTPDYIKKMLTEKANKANDSTDDS